MLTKIEETLEESGEWHFVTGKGVYLIGISVHIKIFQEASCKLTKQKIVGVINCSQTPVSVVVGACASTERAHCNYKKKLLVSSQNNMFVSSTSTLNHSYKILALS